MVRLFQTELEHYEKLEDHRLSLEGKANYLAAMIRRQLPMAMQGLVVIPLFAGYDEEAETGRLFSFDVVGGRYEEIDYTATGSGGRDARSYLRGVYRPDSDEASSIRTAVEALVVAAEEDSATGGPDLRREIYPNVVVVDAAGVREIPEETLAELTRSVLESDL
jgi:proteasome beta subunit